MEHRAGIEPRDNRFAGAKDTIFSVVYGNWRVFNGVEKKAWEFVQWWKNGGAQNVKLQHRVLGA
jgi:hypothetical protein